MTTPRTAKPTAKPTVKRTPLEWGILLIGVPLVVVTPFVFLYWAYQALDEPTDRRRVNVLITLIVEGEHVTDEGALLVARILLVAWVGVTVLTVLVSILHSFRREKNQPASKLETRYVFMDAPFWQVGDRGGWIENGVVDTGVVVEVHRRPFEFGGETVDGASGIPGLVMKSDTTGQLVARKLASLYRPVGTTGASGTKSTIRDAMNAATLVGDETGWLDPSGEPMEGVIVEKLEKPFEVDGKRIDASPARPGYIVERTGDGKRVGISNDLKEGR